MPILRTLIIGTLLSFIVPLQAASTASSASAPTTPAGFAIHRGTNLSHWLSQDFGWTPRAEWITENDIRYIASVGFDHVRLPVDEIALWKEDGSPDETAFALLESALGWIKAAKLRVIVDLHSVRAHHFNASNEGGHNTLWTDPKAQEHFLDLWRQLSARLRKYPNDFLAYEIMNEPTADDPEDWNKLVTRSMEFIRSVEPGRVIVLGANMWQIPQMLPKLKVPAGDKNIILSMHTYAPLLLTHHKAGWVDPVIRDYPGPVAIPARSSIPRPTRSSSPHTRRTNTTSSPARPTTGARTGCGRNTSRRSRGRRSSGSSSTAANSAACPRCRARRGWRTTAISSACSRPRAWLGRTGSTRATSASRNGTG
jgi:endoglucanase